MKGGRRKGNEGETEKGRRRRERGKMRSRNEHRGG